MVKKFVKGGYMNETQSNWLLYIIITILISYIVFLLSKSIQNQKSNEIPINIRQSIVNGIDSTSNLDRFNNPYSPPLRNDYLSFFPGFGGYRSFDRGGRAELDLRGSIPVPIPTNGYPLNYTQIGILTKDESDKHPLILPLMGRRTTSSRGRLQYYTMSNTGTVNTKLPIKIKGRSCTSENGCDEIYSGDGLYVEGYNAKFTATIYENNTFDYIP